MTKETEELSRQIGKLGGKVDELVSGVHISQIKTVKAITELQGEIKLLPEWVKNEIITRIATAQEQCYNRSSSKKRTGDDIARPTTTGGDYAKIKTTALYTAIGGACTFITYMLSLL